MRQMEKQQEMASKESYKEHLLKEIAKNTGANIHDLRNDSHQEMRRARVDSALYFDISHEDVDIGDDMDDISSMGGAQKTDSGVQAQAQTSSSGAQTERPRKTFEAGTQVAPRTRTAETQATEDKSEEIEKLKRASELEKQALIDQQAKNIERVRQQVKAEAETAHEMRKQEYLQEAMQRENIVGTEAQRTINQINQTAQQRAQESVRQEAHQYTATLVNFAENEYQRKKGAAKSQAEKEAAAAKEQAEKEAKAEVAKAKKEAKEAKEQAKKAAQSEHNTEFRADPTTPDKNARAKAKTGPSPKKPPPVPPFPTGERASGSQDNPEYTHEPKGPRGRPANTQAKAKAKAKSKGPDIKVDTKTKPEQPPPKNNKPNHDTDRDVNIKPSYWRPKGIGYMRDQLTKRGFRDTRMPDGSKIYKADYLREILRLSLIHI